MRRIALLLAVAGLVDVAAIGNPPWLAAEEVEMVQIRVQDGCIGKVWRRDLCMQAGIDSHMYAFDVRVYLVASKKRGIRHLHLFQLRTFVQPRQTVTALQGQGLDARAEEKQFLCPREIADMHSLKGVGVFALTEADGKSTGNVLRRNGNQFIGKQMGSRLQEKAKTHRNGDVRETKVLDGLQSVRFREGVCHNERPDQAIVPFLMRHIRTEHGSDRGARKFRHELSLRGPHQMEVEEVNVAKV